MVIVNEHAVIHLNPDFVVQVNEIEVKAPNAGSNATFSGGKKLTIIMRSGREIPVGAEYAEAALLVLRRELNWFEDSSE